MPKSAVKNQLTPSKVEFLVPVNNQLRPLIQIFVRTLDGKTITTNVAKDALIVEIMEQVAEKTGIPALEQRLQFAGKQLISDYSLQDYALQKENTLDLSLRLKGGIGEYQVIEEFIQAKIIHGNVNQIATEESIWGTLLVKDNLEELMIRYGEDIDFDPEVEENMSLLTICFVSLCVEGFQAGNCGEMATWTAAQLIQSTTDQWIYICHFEGTFPLRSDISPDDEDHPLYSHKKGAIDNELDHGIVITYPTKVNSVAEMDTQQATVVDTWYNNLVCSLEDYMATLHPYYNYRYSAEQRLALQPENIKIDEDNPFKAIGRPFATRHDQESTVRAFRQIKEQQKQHIPPEISEIGPSKYDFDPIDVLQDNRSLENLEKLLLHAHSISQHTRAVNEFPAAAMATIMQSSNEEVLQIVFMASRNLSAATFNFLANELARVDAATFELFCRYTNSTTLKKFFSIPFRDYKTNPEFVDSLDRWLNVDIQYKERIVLALSDNQLVYYTASSPARVRLILAMPSSIIGHIKRLLRKIPPSLWLTILGDATDTDRDAIINTVISIDRHRAAQLIKSLTQAQFESYLDNLTDFSILHNDFVDDFVLRAVFEQFSAFGISHTDGTPDTELGEIYAEKLGEEYWTAYTDLN